MTTPDSELVRAADALADYADAVIQMGYQIVTGDGERAWECEESIVDQLCDALAAYRQARGEQG